MVRFRIAFPRRSCRARAIAMNLQQIRGRRIVSAHNRLIRRAMFDDAAGLQVSAASVRPFLLMSKESIQRRVELSPTWPSFNNTLPMPVKASGTSGAGESLRDGCRAASRILAERLARACARLSQGFIEVRPDRRQHLEQPLRPDVVLPSGEQLAEAMDRVRVSWLDIQDLPIAPLGFGEFPVLVKFGCLLQGIGEPVRRSSLPPRLSPFFVAIATHRIRRSFTPKQYL